MLSFQQPWILVGLPLLAVIVWRLSRRTPTALIYSDVTHFQGLPLGRARWQHWPDRLHVLGLVLLLGAASGPRLPDQKTRLPAEGLAIMLVMDVSGSMAAEEFGSPPQSRLQVAQHAFRVFILGGELEGLRFLGRPNDQLGLVVFAAVPETACPLTHDHRVLVQALDQLKPKDGIDAGTNIGDALAEATARLVAANGRNPVLILLSDGEHNIQLDRADRPLMPREAAKLAQAVGVKIYAIDCGSTPGPTTPPDQRKQREDGRKVLEAITSTTSGRAFTATNPAELRDVLKQIDQLETETKLTYRYRRYWELSWPLAALGGGLLLTSYVWRKILWPRLPVG